MVLVRFSDVRVTVVSLGGDVLWGPSSRHAHSPLSKLRHEVCSCLENPHQLVRVDLLAGGTRLKDSDVLSSAVLAAGRMRSDDDPDFCPTKGCIRVPGHAGPCQNDNLEDLPSAFHLELVLVRVDVLLAKAEAIALVRGEPFDVVYQNLSLSRGDLTSAGYEAVSARALQQSGVSLQQILEVGWQLDVHKLKQAGFCLKQLVEAEFPVVSLLKAGFTIKQLLEAGLDTRNIMIVVHPGNGFNMMDMRKQVKDAGLDPEQLNRFNAMLAAMQSIKRASCLQTQMN